MAQPIDNRVPLAKPAFGNSRHPAIKVAARVLVEACDKVPFPFGVVGAHGKPASNPPSRADFIVEVSVSELSFEVALLGNDLKDRDQHAEDQTRHNEPD